MIECWTAYYAPRYAWSLAFTDEGVGAKGRDTLFGNRTLINIDTDPLFEQE